MRAGWVTEENVPALAEMLADLSGKQLDDLDRDAIVYGARDTDSERGQWWQFLFDGPLPLSLDLARDPGTAVVQVRVAVDRLSPEDRARVEMLLKVLNCYRVRE